MNELAKKTKSAPKKFHFAYHILGLIIGLFLGTFVVFQAFFLSKVLPHGGL